VWCWFVGRLLLDLCAEADSGCLGVGVFCCVPAGTNFVGSEVGHRPLWALRHVNGCYKALLCTCYGGHCLCSICRRASCVQSLYLGTVELHKGMSHIGLQAGAAPAIHNTVG